MNTHWISQQSIPQDGSQIVIDDQTVWQDFLATYQVSCRTLDPIKADLLTLPQEDGILFRGRITGKVAFPCNRCSEESVFVLQHTFDSFEPYPADPYVQKTEDDDVEGLEVDEAVMRLAEHGRGVEINPAALAWQEFSLSLPVKPLCSDSCKGLCPVCGSNKNKENCSCEIDNGDPRLAVLRGLAISKKS